MENQKNNSNLKAIIAILAVLVFLVTRIVINKQLHINGFGIMATGIFVIIGLDVAGFFVFDPFQG